MRHADGDLDAAEAALAEAMRSPVDTALSAQGEPSRALLLSHRDRYRDARRAVDVAVAACQRAGAFRDMLTATLAGVVAAGVVCA